MGRSAFKKWFFFFLPPPTPPPPRPNHGAFGLTVSPRKRARVRWYFAPKGAKTLPWPTCWGGSQWFDLFEKAEQVVGEYPYSQSWDRGEPPLGATGQKPCGSQADFQIPKRYDPTASSLKVGAGGLPCCCAPATCSAFALTTPPPFICSCCGTSPMPHFLSLKFGKSGFPWDGQIYSLYGGADPETFNCSWGYQTPAGIYPSMNLGLNNFYEFESQFINIFLEFSDGLGNVWDAEIEFSLAFTCGPFKILTNELSVDLNGVPTGVSSFVAST